MFRDAYGDLSVIDSPDEPLDIEGDPHFLLPNKRKKICLNVSRMQRTQVNVIRTLNSVPRLLSGYRRCTNRHFLSALVSIDIIHEDSCPISDAVQEFDTLLAKDAQQFLVFRCYVGHHASVQPVFLKCDAGVCDRTAHLDHSDPRMLDLVNGSRSNNDKAPRRLVWVEPGDQSPRPPGIFRFVASRQAWKIEAGGPR